eukprot:TRINITY_DN5054_c0_g1_i2.p1 TRINITY_DN5054_c0_g1~~TRINITY_DN5054_c0_g1_i2.p1  ORF type:complete len:281 (-),score=51.64 TRINITY_DN5054_c0_g1_i2:90-854(-)
MDGDWCNWVGNTHEVLRYNERLNIQDAILVRRFMVKDKQGRITTVTSQRIVHMQKKQLGAIKYTVTPENWSGQLQIKSGLDGTVENKGCSRYRELTSKHLKLIEKGTFDSGSGDGIYLTVKTTTSKIEVCTACKTGIFNGIEAVHPTHIELVEREEEIEQIFSMDVKPGKSITIEKLFAICTSRDKGRLNPQEAALDEIKRHSNKRFYRLFSQHQLSWELYWRRADIRLLMTPKPEAVPGEFGTSMSAHHILGL